MRDSDLRDRFREGTQPRGEIDVEAVLRRARARRRPKVALAGAGSVLAIAAIAVPAVLTSSFGGAGGAADSAIVAGEQYAPESASDAGGAGAADQAMAEKAPPDRLNLCTAPVAEPIPSESGLVVTVAPVAASATGHGIPIMVTLTNAGRERITGTTGGRPSVTFARDGITLWHTNGPQDLIARVVDLAPGQSMSYPATFEPVVCGVEDDQSEAFRAELPAAGPGEYTLSAAIEVTSEDGTVIELVSGPPVEITLG